MKRFFAGAAAASVLFIAAGFAGYGDLYLSINKNIDLFGRVYKEIVTNYVDEVDPERFMRSGIDGMLETLDPYTVYYGGKDENEIDLLTNGQYGGIGVSIGVRDGAIIILAPMEGYSAHKQGVRAGDRIVRIDGVPVAGMDPDSVRSRVRGEPGTVVRMTVEREGEKEPVEFTLVREEIQVHNVAYSGYVKEGIGYIRLERFSTRAGEEVRAAVKELQVKGSLKGLILDLRDNPGGLLNAAVDVVSQFAPEGSLVVSTRGRREDEEKEYRVDGVPAAPSVRLAVLVNRSSASASEIVAGAVQDLDRGVILGTRSFGKGLVQTVIPLTGGSSMKITTARYYTPSGRSIQEIDYLHTNRDGVFATTPDSLKREFRTLGGRKVKELGGIEPDTAVENGNHSGYHAELMRKAMVFKFATTYVASHPAPEGEVTATDAVLKEFEAYLAQQKFEYADPAEERLAELKRTMTKERYASASLASVDALLAQLKKERGNAFARYRDETARELSEELNARYRGETGRIRVSLTHDPQVLAAVSLLGSKSYDALLTSKR